MHHLCKATQQLQPAIPIFNLHSPLPPTAAMEVPKLTHHHIDSQSAIPLQLHHGPANNPQTITLIIANHQPMLQPQFKQRNSSANSMAITTIQTQSSMCSIHTHISQASNSNCPDHHHHLGLPKNHRSLHAATVPLGPNLWHRRPQSSAYNHRTTITGTSMGNLN